MKAPRRIVTAHDANGRSTVVYDGPPPASHSIVDGSTFHDIWLTATSPTPIATIEEEPMNDREMVGPPREGSLVRIVDMPPGSKADMHRTETIDYGAVLEGEVTLVLDDGSATTVGMGDVIVQRGTAHAWENRSDTPTRLLFVLLAGRFDDELNAVARDD